MAVGDILAVEIGADGWYADITVAALGTGGTYAFGLGTNNDPSTAKIALTVTSLGFDNTGAATTISRTVYATKQLRQAYPNQTSNTETVVGSDVKVRVVLSDYVYAKDNTGTGNSGTAVTYSVGSGFYTQGGTPNNAGTGTATNSSTAAYPKVVGNWSWVPHETITGSFTLRCVVAHRSGQSGRPVRAVKFTATDAHTNSVTTTVTSPTYDSGMGDAVPVVEYVGTLAATALTQGDLVTVDFQAYPWIGDSASILDTTGGTAAPTPLYGSRQMLCDKSGTYGTSVAVVDGTSGNDATGAVVAGPLNTGSPPAAYLTIAAALNAVRTYNNTNYGRANHDNSTVYLKAGSYAWAGGTVTAGTSPKTWLTLTRYPGVARSSVSISSQSGSKVASNLTKVLDLALTSTAAAGTFVGGGGTSEVWFDNCEHNHTSNANLIGFNTKVIYVTRATLTAIATGLRPFSTTNMSWALVRGSTFVGDTNTPNVVYTVLGNLKTALTGNCSFNDAASGQTTPTMVNAVFAFNKLFVTLGTNGAAQYRATSFTDTHGMMFVQNIIENRANTTSPLVQIAADSSTGDPVDNVIFWHNTLIGQRTNLSYNEVATDTTTTTVLAKRRYWSVKNNIYDDPNIKGDTFAGSGFVASPYKVGSWPVIFGVGCSGELLLETTGISAAGSFLREFPGLKSDQPAGTGSPPTSSTRATTYAAFTNRLAWDGSGSNTTGGGDYSLQGTSPAIGLPRDWLLPYDITGSSRTSSSAAGAITATSTVYTASAASTLPSLTQAAAGTFTAPTYTATAASTLPSLTQSATGTFTKPIYSATAASVLPSLTQAATGTFVAPVYTGTATSSLPALTQQATGTFAPPTYTGVAASVLAALTQTAVGTFGAGVPNVRGYSRSTMTATSSSTAGVTALGSSRTTLATVGSSTAGVS